MTKRVKWIALAMIAIAGPVAQAGTVVFTDSGNIGEFEMTNTGVVAGTARVVFSVPAASSQLNTVNGAPIAPELVSVNTPVTMLVTPAAAGTYDLALVPSTYTKTIGDTPGAQAVLAFNLERGVTSALLPDFFNAAGAVTSVLANADPLLDFGQFAAGGAINFTFTATSFTGASDFAGLFATPGATAVGNGSFSQAAIPEPASVLLFGLGLLSTVILSAKRRLEK